MSAAESTLKGLTPVKNGPLKRVGSSADNSIFKNADNATVSGAGDSKLSAPVVPDAEPHRRIESRSTVMPKNGHTAESSGTMTGAPTGVSGTSGTSGTSGPSGTSGTGAESNSGVFKVPKKLLVSDSREGTRIMSSATSTPSVETFSISIPQPPKVTDIAPALPTVVQTGIPNMQGTSNVTPSQTSLSLPLLERTTIEGIQLANKTSNNTPSVEITSLISPSINDTTKYENNEYSMPLENKDVSGDGDQADFSTSNSPVKLSMNAISNLNKSLKAKQKIINSKDPHPRNVTASSDFNVSPHASTTAINLHDMDDTKPETSKGLEADDSLVPVADSSVKQPDMNTNNSNSKLKPPKTKRISKQASTKTDFFAAKLASAVDDADSSDSDETFVYENNEAPPPTETPEANNTLTTTNEIDLNSSINVNTNNRAPPSTFGDNASVSGSVAPTTFNSPGYEREEYQESIYSLHSSKPPSSPPLPPLSGSARVPALLSANNSYNSNNYLESFMKEKRPPMNQKSFSSYSFNDDTLNAHKEVKEGFDSECDDGDIDEEPYFEGESESGRMNTVVIRSNPGNSNSNGAEKQEESDTIAPPLTGLNTQGGKKKKPTSSISSSSKLRSTTSKLFDKKGSHPRRYSTIPDDIDIEDFDDELIYYDNNIRFPYNNSNTNFSEQSPLLPQNGQVRIPHYRSLNFNANGSKRKPSNMKSKRFISANQPIGALGNGSVHNVNMNPTSPVNGGNSPNSNGNNNPNYDVNMFPFPYGKNNQYYYDIDEYDPELQGGSGANSPINRADVNLGFDDLGINGNGYRSGSGRYGFPNKNDHFALPRKQSRELRGGPYFIRSFVYTVFSIFCILMLGFMMGFILASTKDLNEFSVTSIENPVVSQDELVFNMVVNAINPGWFSISVQDVELDIFAKSGYLETDRIYHSSVETVLLGTIYELETPLEFPGGFFDRHPIEQMTAVKLLSPGKNLTGVARAYGNKDDNNSTLPDNSKKWEVISKHPFDLIIRGVVKYSLPISLNVKSVVVNKVAYINPEDMSFDSKRRVRRAIG